MQDEDIGDDYPNKDEEISKQLEARKGHDTWDQIEKLKDMPVICCASSKDQISPTEIVKKMADKIGCSSKLDFDWGHPFVAADEKAFPW